jgi:ABC-2 type transport system permease protein
MASGGDLHGAVLGQSASGGDLYPAHHRDTWPPETGTRAHEGKFATCVRPRGGAIIASRSVMPNESIQTLGSAKLLAAKYLAIILTVMTPLLIGMIISLLIAGISEPQIYIPGILQKLLLFFLLSFLYLSFFALLSLLVSSLIHQSSLVLLALLTIWVLFAVMIPNTSGILAERFSKAPSEYQIAKRLGPMLQQEVMDKIRKLLGKVKKGEIKSEEELKLSADPVFEEAQNELTEYFKLYENTMKERQRMGRNISRISPSSLFHYAAQAVAGTGTERENNFNEEICQKFLLSNDK